MKSGLISVLSIFLIFLITINSYAALRIDGADNDLEWEDAECINPITNSDSNNVSFGLLKCLFDSNGYDAYFMLYLSDNKSESLDKCGFIFSLNDGVEVTVTADNVQIDCNSSLYNISAETGLTGDDGICCEIKVGFKKGLPDAVNGTVSYIDGTGNNSYYYPFNFFYRESTVTETVTVKATEYITAEKTTKAKTTSAPKTTKDVIEKVSASATKRTEKTVVYFYEKDVYISEVYITDIIPVSHSNISEESTTVPVIAETTQRSFQIADGIMIQKVVCAVGGLIFIALAAWVGLSAKKNHKDKENCEAQKDDNK